MGEKKRQQKHNKENWLLPSKRKLQKRFGSVIKPQSPHPVCWFDSVNIHFEVPFMQGRPAPILRGPL